MKRIIKKLLSFSQNHKMICIFTSLLFQIGYERKCKCKMQWNIFNLSCILHIQICSAQLRYFRYSIVIKEKKNTFRKKKKKMPEELRIFFSQNIFFWSECWIIRFKLVVLKDYCFILNKSKFRLQIDWGGCYWSSVTKHIAIILLH